MFSFVFFSSDFYRFPLRTLLKQKKKSIQQPAGKRSKKQQPKQDPAPESGCKELQPVATSSKRLDNIPAYYNPASTDSRTDTPTSWAQGLFRDIRGLRVRVAVEIRDLSDKKEDTKKARTLLSEPILYLKF